MELIGFLQSFDITKRQQDIEDKSFYKDLPSDLFAFLQTYGGVTFDKGLYRVHSFSGSLKWSLMIGEYFPEYMGRIYPFSYDWMGKQFCCDSTGRMLLMFDPETGEVGEFQQTIPLLHNNDFASDKDGMLSSGLFKDLLLKMSLPEIGYGQCLTYKVPLFLGGKEEIDNYAVQDIEAYWQIQSQIYKQIKDLPDGTVIGKVDLTD